MVAHADADSQPREVDSNVVRLAAQDDNRQAVVVVARTDIEAQGTVGVDIGVRIGVDTAARIEGTDFAAAQVVDKGTAERVVDTGTAERIVDKGTAERVVYKGMAEGLR